MECGQEFIAEGVPWLHVPGGRLRCNMDAHPGRDHQFVREDGLVLRQAHPLEGYACGSCGARFRADQAAEAFLHGGRHGGRYHTVNEVRG